MTRTFCSTDAGDFLTRWVRICWRRAVLCYLTVASPPPELYLGPAYCKDSCRHSARPSKLKGGCLIDGAKFFCSYPDEMVDFSNYVVCCGFSVRLSDREKIFFFPDCPTGFCEVLRLRMSKAVPPLINTFWWRVQGQLRSALNSS